MIRVLLVDDHPALREGLKHIFEKTCDIRAAVEAGTGRGALDALHQDQFDVVVLDLRLPDGPGLFLLKKMLATWPILNVIILSMHPDGLYFRRVLAAGALGYLSKDSSLDSIIDAVRVAARGRVFLTMQQRQQTVDIMRRGHPGHPLDSLSDRELEVLVLLAEGWQPKRIGEYLGITPQTVSTYRGRIEDKLVIKHADELQSYLEELRCDQVERRQLTTILRVKGQPPPSLEIMTARELRVLLLRHKSWTVDEIALYINLTVPDVQRIMECLFQKLGLRDEEGFLCYMAELRKRRMTGATAKPGVQPEVPDAA